MGGQLGRVGLNSRGERPGLFEVRTPAPYSRWMRQSGWHWEETTTDVVAARVAEIAAVLNEEFLSLTRALRDRLSTEIAQLGDDERLIHLLGASIEGNVETILHVLQHGIELKRVEVPPAAVEYARRLAQNGIAVDALIRAYRLGQDSFLQRAFLELHSEDPALMAGVVQRLTAISFGYIDRVSQQVIAVYEDERERWLQNRNTVRAARIRELLDDRVDDVFDAEVALGYRLRHQRHLGAVVWAVEGKALSQEVSRLEHFVRELADRLGCAGPPLFVPSDEAAAWAWLSLDHGASEPDRARVAAVVADCGAGVNLALGRPGADVDGFRRTHLQARQVQALALLSGRDDSSVTLFEDVGPVALLCGDLQATRAWVLDTRGRLALDDPAHERMRETLRVFLSVGGSYTAAAGELLLHKNSVQYRVRKAEEQLGHPLRSHRLEVELALSVCHWLGPAVLLPAD